MLQIRWNNFFLMICSFFILYFFLFKLQYFLKLKQTRKSLQLKFFSFSSRNIWILSSSQLWFFSFSFVFWNIKSRTFCKFFRRIHIVIVIFFFNENISRIDIFARSARSIIYFYKYIFNNCISNILCIALLCSLFRN